MDNFNEFLDKFGVFKHVTPIRDMKKNRFYISDKKCFNDTFEPNDFFLKKGCVYFLVANNEVVKIGETSRTISERLKEYNGKDYKFITEDLCSYFSRCFDVYVMYTDDIEMTFNGTKTNVTSKMLEQHFISNYVEEFGKLPYYNRTYY